MCVVDVFGANFQPAVGIFEDLINKPYSTHLFELRK